MTLAEDHLGLAFHIARRYHAPDEEAVTGEALAALARAEREFDPARGRFPAFAGRLIERACLAETLRQRGRGTEVPLTIPIPGEDGEERERPELAHHPRETDRLLGLQAAALLARLPERQRRILVLRFGLEDGQESSLLDADEKGTNTVRTDSTGGCRRHGAHPDSREPTGSPRPGQAPPARPEDTREQAGRPSMNRLAVSVNGRGLVVCFSHKESVYPKRRRKRLEIDAHVR